MKEKTVEEVYQEFWVDIVGLDLNDHEQVKKELCDFSQLMDNISKVYCHITGDQISKPLTDPDVVCSVADGHYQELYSDDKEIIDFPEHDPDTIYG